MTIYDCAFIISFLRFSNAKSTIENTDHNGFWLILAVFVCLSTGVRGLDMEVGWVFISLTIWIIMVWYIWTLLLSNHGTLVIFESSWCGIYGQCYYRGTLVIFESAWCGIYGHCYYRGTLVIFESSWCGIYGQCYYRGTLVILSLRANTILYKVVLIA